MIRELGSTGGIPDNEVEKSMTLSKSTETQTCMLGKSTEQSIIRYLVGRQKQGEGGAVFSKIEIVGPVCQQVHFLHKNVRQSLVIFR